MWLVFKNIYFANDIVTQAHLQEKFIIQKIKLGELVIQYIYNFKNLLYQCNFVGVTISLQMNLFTLMRSMPS